MPLTRIYRSQTNFSNSFQIAFVSWLWSSLSFSTQLSSTQSTHQTQIKKFICLCFIDWFHWMELFCYVNGALFEKLFDWLQLAYGAQRVERMNEQGRGNGISETNGMDFGRGKGAAAHNPQQFQHSTPASHSIHFFHWIPFVECWSCCGNLSKQGMIIAN